MTRPDPLTLLHFMWNLAPLPARPEKGGGLGEQGSITKERTKRFHSGFLPAGLSTLTPDQRATVFHNRNERRGEKKKSSAELHNIVLVPVTLVVALGAGGRDSDNAASCAG